MPLRYPHVLLAVALLTTAALPAQTRLLVCESTTSACSRPNAKMDTVWAFDGTQGTATAPDASTSMLTLETFTADTLVVRRSYPNGLTARYTGTITGTHVAGNVEWLWPGHTDYPPGGIFTAILQKRSTAPVPVPSDPPESTP